MGLWILLKKKDNIRNITFLRKTPCKFYRCIRTSVKTAGNDRYDSDDLLIVIDVLVSY